MNTTDARTLLLVEDQSIVALSEKKLLEANGYTVHTAHDGATAVQMGIEYPEIDLVLMDVDLGNGIDGTVAARRMLEYRELPIVFLTSHSEKEYVERVEKITHYGYVLKNSGEFVLVQSIKMAFKLFEANLETREREQRYALLFHNTHSPMFLLRPETGEIVDVNPAACNFYGWTAEEFTQMRVQDMNALSDRDSLEELERAWLEEKKRFQFKHYLADGSMRDVEVRSNPVAIGGETLLYSIVNDVTDRVIAEQALKQSEMRFRRIYEHSAIGLAWASLDFRIQTANEAYCSMLGYSEEEIRGLSIATITAAEYIDENIRQVSRLARGEIDHFRMEKEYVHRDGTRIPAILDANLLRDAAGNPSHIISSVVDTSEIRQLEKAQREERRFLSGVLDSFPDNVAVIDEDGTIIAVNESWKHYARENHSDWDDYGIGRSYLEPLVKAEGDYVSEAREAAAGIRSLLAGQQATFTMEYPCDTPRERAWFLMRGSRFESGTRRYVVAIHSDITARKLAEEELKQAFEQQRQRIREINHRSKNNITMIASLISLKDSKLGDAADLSDIHNQARTLALIHEKLDMNEDVRRIDFGGFIADLLEGVFSLYSGPPVSVRIRANNITLETRTAVTLGLIVNELATNAVKYGFPGTIEPACTLLLEPVPGDEREPSYVLTFSSNGSRLPDHIDLRTVGSNGLALVSTLTEQLGGSVDVEREPETTFIIRFSE